MFRKIFKWLFILGLILGLIGTAAGFGFGLYHYFRLTRDLPKLERISDYNPKAVTSIYAEDGTLISEIYEQRRYPVKLSEIPPLVRNAFLAAEDAQFYQHPGVSLRSIARAVIKNLQKKDIKQGASTITQQVVRSLLLERKKTYERKAKEAILSYRLEKALTKDEIFNIYLNEIFLGNTAYGVRAAAKVHFKKELSELTLAEAAFLAGLPQQPSRLVNPKYHEDALHRRKYVLERMFENKMISAEERDEANKVPLVLYPPERAVLPNTEYFAGYAQTILEEKLRQIDRNWTPTSPGGFEVHTTADVHALNLATVALQKGIREVDKRRGWRGPQRNPDQGEKKSENIESSVDRGRSLEKGKLYWAEVKNVNKAQASLEVKVGDFIGSVDLKKALWARKFLDSHDDTKTVDPLQVLKVGDSIEVSLDEEKNTSDKIEDSAKKIDFILDQTPQLEGAFVLANTQTGEVKAIIGGYDYNRSEFNRATQGLRQPGSSFKPFIYLSAIETLHYTPSTIVPDSPISMPGGDGKVWTPGNFDGKFLGPITLRTALQKSRNVISVYLLQHVGIDRGIEVARRLGITTPIPREMSISLGAAEVKLIEMVRAYGAIATGGWLADSLVVTQVKDRAGKVVYEGHPNQKKVIADEDAFILANMMKGVVERGTATVVKALNRPVAGKTGTTNDQMDTWFIGYTPDWVAGVWVGFDVKKTIGRLETGGKVAAPIFLNFMKEFLADLPVLDFAIPDGVIPVLVNINSGQPTSPDDPAAFLEYFKSGTEPTASGDGSSTIPQEYLSNDEF